jgi:hypothetical protein
MLAPYASLKNQKEVDFSQTSEAKKSKKKIKIKIKSNPPKDSRIPPFIYIGNVVGRSKDCLLYFNRLLEFRFLLLESPVIFEVAISEPIYS